MRKVIKNPWVLFIVILIIASFFRFYQIAKLPPGFYPDEAMYANNGIEAWETGHFKVFYPENYGREGLWPNIIGFLVVRFGHEPWISRAVAAVFGLLTVLGVYFLTRELFNPILRTSDVPTSDVPDIERNFRTSEVEALKITNSILRGRTSVANKTQYLGSPTSRTSDVRRLKINEKIALLSSFFLATSFWHINFSRIAFRAIMAPFFLVWGIYFLIKSLNLILRTSDVVNIKNKVQLTGLCLVGGIFYGLGFHTYIAYRATPLLILIILVFYWFKIKNSILRTSDVPTSDVPDIERNFRTSEVEALKITNSILRGRTSVANKTQYLGSPTSRTSDVQKLKWELTRKIILLSIFYFLLSTFIVALPLGLYFLQNPQDFFGRTTQISIFSSPGPVKSLGINILKTAGMFNFVGDSNWRHNYAGKPELFWPVGILFLIGVFLAIKTLIQNSILRTSDVQNIDGNLGTSDVQKLKFGFLILFVWLIVASLPVIVSNERLPHALRAILMAPPVFILAGVGGLWLYEFIKSRILILRTSDVPNIENNNFRTSDVRRLKRIKMKMLNIFVFIFLSLLIFEAYNTYFIKWGQNSNTYAAFSANYLEIGRQLNALPKELPKYVVVKAPGMEVRGIPMPAQTVMFITDTFSPEKQKDKNIFYILLEQINQIPQNSYTVILK